eukprot:CAMPEP_0194335242 /NCGR_PEP_ID=MMETSP0171-20130528/68871_1 /TAXON_ID=218684 /ORGANISM="Corethron pennatum, Strain L29A3" /LENGTH=166 /DNA_ID=CAMNT_0039098231 /DNA_START=53 /DNA_END=553 /DNA_ORIENTATION=+
MTAAPAVKSFSAGRQDTAVAPPHGKMDVYLRFKPLVGGPQFLPVHAEVWTVLPPGKTVRYDFLPADPLAPETVRRLLSLRSVPGECRVRWQSTSCGTGEPPQMCLKLGTAAVDGGVTLSCDEFCDRYRSERGELNLLANNCYTFAYALVRHVGLASIDLSIETVSM